VGDDEHRQPIGKVRSVDGVAGGGAPAVETTVPYGVLAIEDCPNPPLPSETGTGVGTIGGTGKAIDGVTKLAIEPGEFTCGT
jgi:hypothetical protein